MNYFVSLVMYVNKLMLMAVVHNGRKRELLEFQARLPSHDMEYHMHNTKIGLHKMSASLKAYTSVIAH
jgi:hypothetical protein